MSTVASASLKIIAEPNSNHRDRYESEVEWGHRLSRRFIRTAVPELPYPTVQIPDGWENRSIFIRLTSVVVLSETVQHRLIHPYPIDTPDLNVIHDRETNSIYFPVSTREMINRTKSFLLMRTKLVRSELLTRFPLRYLNSDKHEEDFRIEARKLIEYYQLNKFQLVFSIVELCGRTSQPIIYEQTSAYSIVVTSSHCSFNHVTEIHYAPKESNGQFSQEILLCVPQIRRCKRTTVFIEFPSRNTRNLLPWSMIDTKTISCQSPPCLPENDEQECAAFIIVEQNQTNVVRLPFLYRFKKDL